MVTLTSPDAITWRVRARSTVAFAGLAQVPLGLAFAVTGVLPWWQGLLWAWLAPSAVWLPWLTFEFVIAE